MNIGVEPTRTDNSASMRILERRNDISDHFVFNDYKKRKYLDPHTHMKMYAKFVNDQSRQKKNSSVERASVKSRGSMEKSVCADDDKTHRNTTLNKKSQETTISGSLLP